MIKFNNINLSYNGRTIFKDFNLEVKAGAKVVLKGSSGSGKTTLLNLLLGFTIPDKGMVVFNKYIVNHSNIRSIRKHLAWLPQNFNVLKADTVRESIYLPFTFHENKHNRPNDNTINEYLERLNLVPGMLESNIDNISGGEKQRIGLVICRLLKKPVLLLDEPTSALDKDSKSRVIEFILKDEYLTVLSTSHDDEWIEGNEMVVDLNN